MTLVRKSDNVIQVTINGGDGNPVTISGLSDLEIVAYQLPKTIIQRWLMSATQVSTINDAGGVVEVNFDRSKTKLLNFQKEELKLEVIATFADADFEDNLRREVATNLELKDSNGVVEDSPTAYEQ